MIKFSSIFILTFFSDPDITRNDGIYSRYLTGITDSGYYSLTVVAEKKVLKHYKPVIGKHLLNLFCYKSLGDMKKITLRSEGKMPYLSVFSNTQAISFQYLGKFSKLIL